MPTSPCPLLQPRGAAWRWWLGAALLVLLAFAALPAHAASAPAQYPLDQAFDALDKFRVAMDAQVAKALTTDAVKNVANTLFVALATSYFIWTFAGFALRGFDMLALLETMMTILFVLLLMTSYSTIVTTIFGGGRSIATLLGTSIIGAAADTSLSQAILENFSRMSFEPMCDGGLLGCLGSGILAMVATVLGWVLLILLGVLAVLIDLWVTWSFEIAFAVGWVTIPFMLYERLGFLFDGWLKFFMGTIVYALVANANIALVYLSIQMMLGSGPVKGGEVPATIQVSGIFDVMGLLVMVAVGIYSLLSTGSFASAIVGGAAGGGGGLAGAVGGAARGAALGGAGALAGAAKAAAGAIGKGKGK
jgi:TrbL/VirB6 plasmid conjugal transfer protein